MSAGRDGVEQETELGARTAPGVEDALTEAQTQSIDCGDDAQTRVGNVVPRFGEDAFPRLGVVWHRGSFLSDIWWRGIADVDADIITSRTSACGRRRTLRRRYHRAKTAGSVTIA
jgi:hypothetical protein